LNTFLIALIGWIKAGKQAIIELCSTCRLATVLLTTVTLIENVRLCSSMEAGIVLNLFLNFEQK